CITASAARNGAPTASPDWRYSAKAPMWASQRPRPEETAMPISGQRYCQISGYRAEGAQVVIRDHSAPTAFFHWSAALLSTRSGRWNGGLDRQELPLKRPCCRDWVTGAGLFGRFSRLTKPL